MKKYYVKEFLSDDSTREVNMDDRSKKHVKELIEKSCDQHVFDSAENQIWKLLQLDKFPKFPRTEIFKNFQTKLIEVEERLLNRNIVTKWATDFDSLMTFQTGHTS